MNKQAIALALRTAAENLERAKDLVKGLPARIVDDDSALALWLDAPKVLAALYNVAGTLDPEGLASGEDELVGDLFDTSPARRANAC